MVSNVKKGDRVVTGGLIGTVTDVSENEVDIDFDNNIKIKSLKSTLGINQKINKKANTYFSLTKNNNYNFLFVIRLIGLPNFVDIDDFPLIPKIPPILVWTLEADRIYY